MSAADCAIHGHEPPEARHWGHWQTTIRCSGCGKAVVEFGLADHPHASDFSDEAWARDVALAKWEPKRREKLAEKWGERGAYFLS